MTTADKIEIVTGGDLLRDGSDAAVIPVNCLGVMGAGLALSARRAFPGVYRPYRLACAERAINPGDAKLYDRLAREGAKDAPRYLILVATKGDWKHPSKTQWIVKGVNSVVRVVNRLEDALDVSAPALGCGLGGLDWRQIKPIMERGFAKLSEGKTARLYAPQERTRGATR